MSTVIHDVARQALAAQLLLSNLRDILADDETARHDAIEGETTLVEAIAASDVRLLEIASLAAGIGAAAEGLAARKQRLDNQAERIRAAILSAMSAVDLRKLELPTGTVSLAASPASVRILSEHDIPSAFLVEKTTITPDKKALLAALKEGASIPGVELANGAPRLTIRRQ